MELTSNGAWPVVEKAGKTIEEISKERAENMEVNCSFCKDEGQIFSVHHTLSENSVPSDISISINGVSFSVASVTNVTLCSHCYTSLYKDIKEFLKSYEGCTVFNEENLRRLHSDIFEMLHFIFFTQYGIPIERTEIDYADLINQPRNQP